MFIDGLRRQPLRDAHADVEVLPPDPPPAGPDVTPDVEAICFEAAEQVAMAYGRPEVAPIVAEKLRLTMQLRARSARREPRRWWSR